MSRIFLSTLFFILACSGCMPNEELPKPTLKSGFVTTQIGTESSYIKDITLSANNKILLVGSVDDPVAPGSDIMLARYSKSGQLDTSFGGENGSANGVVTLAIGSLFEALQAVRQQADGKIIAAGYTNNGSDEDFLLVRFNSNGSLDKSFGANGVVTTDFGLGNDRASSLIIQPDGKYVLGGYAYDSSNKKAFAVARYHTNGLLDSDEGSYTGFASTGKKLIDIGAGHDEAFSALIQPDGHIVMAGSAQLPGLPVTFDIALARVTATGELDTTFDHDGKLSTHLNSGDNRANAVIIQDDSKLVIGGFTYNGSNNDMLLIRYHSDGSLDTDFDGDSGSGNGIVKIEAQGSYYNDYFSDLVMDLGGRFVAVGKTTAFDSGFADFLIARINSNGTLDSSFNGSGIKSLQILPSANDSAQAVNVQADGKYLAAGSGYQDPISLVHIARFNNDGGLDKSFGD